MDNIKKGKIAELVKLKYPDECMVVGDVVVNDLIEDYSMGTENAGEKYRDAYGGFNFSIDELAILIFTGIQAMAALVDIINQFIEKYKENKDKKQLQESVMQALLDSGISQQDAEDYCRRNFS